MNLFVAEVRVKWISLSTSNAIWCYGNRSIEIMHRKLATISVLSIIFSFLLWRYYVMQNGNKLKCSCWAEMDSIWNVDDDGCGQQTKTHLTKHLQTAWLASDAMRWKENSFRLNQFEEKRNISRKKSSRQKKVSMQKFVCFFVFRMERSII